MGVTIALISLVACGNSSKKSTESSKTQVQYNFTTLKNFAKSLESAGWRRQPKSTGNLEIDKVFGSVTVNETYGNFAVSVTSVVETEFIAEVQSKDGQDYSIIYHLGNGSGSGSPWQLIADSKVDYKKNEYNQLSDLGLSQTAVQGMIPLASDYTTHKINYDTKLNGNLSAKEIENYLQSNGYQKTDNLNQLSAQAKEYVLKKVGINGVGYVFHIYGTYSDLIVPHNIEQSAISGGWEDGNIDNKENTNNMQDLSQFLID